MKFYDTASNPNTLEKSLVERVRLCLKGNRKDEYERRNLKEAISELRTFRTNRARNPELHAKLDKAAIETYRGSGWLTNSTAKWDLFCRNKHILTHTRIDEPQQESLIDGIPAPAEKQGRVRENPPVERITKEYYTSTREDIDNGTLTPYLPVRQMIGFIVETAEQTAFLQRVRNLADAQREHKDHCRDYKRIHRLASRVLIELHEASKQGTLW